MSKRVAYNEHPISDSLLKACRIAWKGLQKEGFPTSHFRLSSLYYCRKHLVQLVLDSKSRAQRKEEEKLF